MMALETWGLQEHLTLALPGHPGNTQRGKCTWGLPLVISWMTSLSLGLSFSYCTMETNWCDGLPGPSSSDLQWFCNSRMDVETQRPMGSGGSPKQARWGCGGAGECTPPLTGQLLLSPCWLLPHGNAGLLGFLIFQEDLEIANCFGLCNLLIF